MLVTTAVVLIVIVASASAAEVVTYNRNVSPRNSNKLFVNETGPFFPSGASIQFRNPNGMNASKTLVSVYMHPVNSGGAPLNINNSKLLVVRSFSNSYGLFTFPFNGLIDSVAMGWRSNLTQMGGKLYADAFETSFAVTAVEQLANNTTWSTITYLRFSPGLLLRYLNDSAFHLAYEVTFNIFIDNAKQQQLSAYPHNTIATPDCVGGRCLHCTPGYYWKALGSTITPNIWVPVEWVNNLTTYGGGSIGYTLGISGEDTVFQAGVYNTVKGAWSVNSSQPTSTPAYGNIASEAFTNYKSAVIFINASVTYSEYQYVYVNYYCQVTSYNDYQADIYVNNVGLSGSNVMMMARFSPPGGDLSSILPQQMQGFPKVVYTSFGKQQNFSSTIKPFTSKQYSYFRLTSSTSSLANYVSGFLPLGGVMTSFMNWAKTINSDIVGIAIPYVSDILSGISFEKTVVVGADISLQNGQNFDISVAGYSFQSIQQYDLSGWNSGTAGILLSYWNVTGS